MGVMSRTARVAPGGLVYHVLNRSVGKMHMMRKEADFEEFERVMVERISASQSGSCRIACCRTIGTLLSGRSRKVS